MHTWSWQTWDGSSYLTCSLLSRWPHGFFTRQTWPQTPDYLVSAVHPEAKAIRVKQVHGNQVLGSNAVLQFLEQQLAQQTEASPVWPEADGLVSDAHHQSVWVCSADCTPVLIADERTGHVAAIHAGWRGTAAKIVPRAIAQMLAKGSAIADLRVAMGPAIAGEVYQVSKEVASKVGQSILELDDLDLPKSEIVDKTVSEMLMDLPYPPILADEKEGHVRLDVRRINALQLEQMGFSPDQVAISPHCTYQDPERFFSYRRDHLKQIQWSGIVSTPCS
jgi:polyphenol oxidase